MLMLSFHLDCKTPYAWMWQLGSERIVKRPWNSDAALQSPSELSGMGRTRSFDARAPTP